MRLIALALALVTAACASGGGPRPEPPPQMATLAVVATSHGQPVEGAVLDVSAIPGTQDAVTNSDGYAAVTVPQGLLFAAQLTKDGHIPWWAEVRLTGNQQLAIDLQRDGPPPNVASPLRIEGNQRWFANDQGRFDYRETSLFALGDVVLREGLDAAIQQIEIWQGLGFNVGRVAASYTHYGGLNRGMFGPETPGYWDAVHRLTQEAGARGFYIRWTLWMAVEPFGGVWHPDRRDVWSGEVRRRGEEFGRRFVSELRQYPNVVFELANEPSEIGMRDSFDELVAFGREVKQLAPDRILNAGSPRNEGDQSFTREPFDFSDAHLPRHYVAHEEWGTWKRATDHPLIDPAHQRTRMPFTQGEPGNRGPAPGRGDYDLSSASSFCGAAISRVTASYATFHWDGGVFGRTPDALVERLARAWVRGLDAFPMPGSYSLWRGHHAESPVRSAPFAPSDDARDVEDHVRRGNLWRVVGVGNHFVGLMEASAFDMARHASRPITRVDREVDGAFACGVYRW